MPFPVGSVAIHNDGQHTGSAKRDMVNGVAGLDSNGYVLGMGGALLLPRDVSERIYISERTSVESAAFLYRSAANTYQLQIFESGVEKRVQTESMKNVASGIAGLDAAAQISPSVFPAGMILLYGGTTAPTGWLLCDGSAISRTTYAALFAIIGTSYGVGDGSTTYNLPNFLGRAILGTGSGAGLTARARGDTGGVETHALSEAELPAHTHTIPSGTGGGTGANYLEQVTSSGSRASGSVGSGTAHQNMPPFAVATYIIKT